MELLPETPETDEDIVTYLSCKTFRLKLTNDVLSLLAAALPNRPRFGETAAAGVDVSPTGDRLTRDLLHRPVRSGNARSFEQKKRRTEDAVHR